MPKKPPYWIGLDLGQSADFSALSVSHRTMIDGLSHYGVVELSRWALGAPYPGIVRDVVNMCQRPKMAEGWKLVIDKTGVGAPVFDMFREAGMRPIGVSITAGQNAHRDPDDRMCWTVPKVHLVSNAKVLLQSGRLTFADRLPNVDDLVKEMLSFEMRFTTAANVTFESWREGAHDDLLLSLCVALWVAEYGQQYRGGIAFPNASGGESTHRPGVKDVLPMPRTGAEINEEAEREQVAKLSRSRKVRIRLGRVGGGLEIHELARKHSLSTRQIQWVLEADD